ncbi:hypothetical protein D3C84_299940 [compost metagenome]
MGAVGLDPVGIGQAAQGRVNGRRGKLLLQFVQAPAAPEQRAQLRLLRDAQAAASQALGGEYMGGVEQLRDAEGTGAPGEEAEAHLPQGPRAIAQSARQARQVAEEGHLEFALGVLQQVEGAGEGGDLQVEIDVRHLLVEGADQVQQRAGTVRLGQPRHLGHRHPPLLRSREWLHPGQAQAEKEHREETHGTPVARRYA